MGNKYMVGYGLHDSDEMIGEPMFFETEEAADDALAHLKSGLGVDADYYEFVKTDVEGKTFYEISTLPVRIYSDNIDDALDTYMARLMDSAVFTLVVSELDISEGNVISQSVYDVVAPVGNGEKDPLDDIF
jgi:hypothetical protein